MLKQPFVTKQVTIRPNKWKGNVGLRMELYGCIIGKLLYLIYRLSKSQSLLYQQQSFSGLHLPGRSYSTYDVYIVKRSINVFKIHLTLLAWQYFIIKICSMTKATARSLAHKKNARGLFQYFLPHPSSVSCITVYVMHQT